MKQVLIIGPAWVGDMIMAQSLVMWLKRHHPAMEIDILAPEWTIGIIQRMPEVRNAIPISIRHGELNLKKRYEIGKQLRQTGYDQAIILPNSFKSALIPFWAKIPIRTGWVGEYRWGFLNDARSLNKNLLPRTVDRFVALALDKFSVSAPQDIPQPTLTAANPEIIQQLTAQLGIELNATQPILGLAPGAEYGPAKRWPPEYFAKVANHYLAQDWQVWIFGSKNDQSVAQTVNQLTDKKCLDLTGRTALGEAVDLMSLVDLVISNDSGLMHLAAALKKPLIAIYGSSSPIFTPPLSSQASIVSLGLNCSPCFKRECPLQHLKCLRDITPEKIISLAETKVSA